MDYCDCGEIKNDRINICLKCGYDEEFECEEF
jgi:hypothetical protein